MTRAERWLGLAFLLSLIFMTPSVRGDGVGYYALIRAPLIEHSFDFEKDWRLGYPAIQVGAPNGTDSKGFLGYTRTGHLGNFYAVGPALLWAPFLIVAHVAVLAANAVGAHIAADGFSKPYIYAMAIGTAVYTFFALILAFRLACRYVESQWALLATIGVWLASSFPAYLYVFPSWSHVQSAFAVGLFVWYWDGTRGQLRLRRWALLGLAAALMINIYYVNALFLLLPFLETGASAWRMLHGSSEDRSHFAALVRANFLFVAACALGLVPTLLTKLIIFGSPFRTGYTNVSQWHWSSPHLLGVLFSSDHGLLVWTPIIIPAIAGLIAGWNRIGDLARYSLAVFAVFTYVVASHVYWDGVASFGNRFFISFTPIFVAGLANALKLFAGIWRESHSGFVRAAVIVAILAVWNIGFLFQCATGLAPLYGPISWNEMVYNQFRTVPQDASSAVFNRLTGWARPRHLPRD
jgi:hypothetical protein